jgi:hypothetical protein
MGWCTADEDLCDGRLHNFSQDKQLQASIKDYQ